MKIFKYLLIVVILNLSLQANINKEYYFGVTVYKFDKSNQNRIKRVIIKLTNEWEKIFDEKINIIFIEDEKDLLNEYKKFEKINTLITFTTFYLENKEELQKYSKEPFLFNNDSNVKTQYYLIANKKSGIKSIEDIKNKTFSTLSIDRGYSIWLDYLVRKKLNQSLNSIIKKKNEFYTNARLLLNVYFNKSDFTVVSKIVYDDMLLLNPSIKKNLVILEKSKPMFFFAIGLFHKNTPQKLVDSFMKVVNNGLFNKKFEDLFVPLNLYGAQKTSFDEIKVVHDYYDEYKKLKRMKNDF